MKQHYIDVLEKILNGYHPVTGEVLPYDHILCEPDVIRALHYAIGSMKSVDKDEITKFKTLPQKRLSTKREWTEADDRMLCELYRDNIPIKEIAKRLSCRVRGIEKRLDYLREVKRQQVERMKYQNQSDLSQAVLYNRNARWIEEDEKKLLELFEERKALSEIAARLGRTPKAIEYRMIHLGLIDKHGQYTEGIRPWTSKDTELLHVLYEEGMDIKLIAERFEVSEEAIRSRLFYMGLTKDAPSILPKRIETQKKD